MKPQDGGQDVSGVSCRKRRGGSPAHTRLRTFVWARFELPRRVYTPRPSGTIRNERPNPIALALAWQRRLDSSEVASRAELARQVGVTPAYVTQVLSLLLLVPEVKSLVLSFGDPMRAKGIGIHRLRSLLRLPAEEQIRWIKQTQSSNLEQ